jgi:hypothetical protein
MMIRRSGALAALSAALFLAGCAGSGSDLAAGASVPSASVDPATSGSPVADPSTTVDPSATAGAAKPGSSGSAKVAAGATETLTGQVIAGVEPGCLVLTGPRGAHLLVVNGDAAKTVKVGTTVTVTGHAEPGMMTTCQQGTPFVVSAARVG